MGRCGVLGVLISWSRLCAEGAPSPPLLVLLRQGDAVIVKPSFIYGGEEFAIAPPRVTKTYGGFIETLLSLGPVRSLAKISCAEKGGIAAAGTSSALSLIPEFSQARAHRPHPRPPRICGERRRRRRRWRPRGRALGCRGRH